MTERDPHAVSGTPPVEAPPPSTMRLLGLRLRVWAACLSGALVSVAALWWIAGTQITVRSDPASLLAWLLGAGTLGIVVGIACAMWLDHGIVVHLRGLTRGFASGRVQELRGLPAASGWGELSELTEWAAVLITRQRVASRAAGDLEELGATLTRAVERLEAWRANERWEALSPTAGPGETLVRELNDTFARVSELAEQNLEAARRVRAELVSAAGEARESAAQAERGFVEATALLTTVRELQRLAQELRHAIVARAAETPEPAAVETVADRVTAWRTAVESAVEELAASSDASVEHLGAALRRVQDIAAQVQVVSQRATLVALQAVAVESRLPREERRGEELSQELRLLTAEVRTAAEHADTLAVEVERESRVAGERVRIAREWVDREMASAADEPAAPAPPPAAAAPLSENAMRLLERVREMIQDATQKGERLSANGERASRSAERLIHRLEEESRELEGLMVRLSPPAAGSRAIEAEPAEPVAPAELKLLEPAAAAATETSGGEEVDDVALETGEERP